ncbi:hypothetical protein ASE70_05550 [Sphingomonas sp. Leaf22]|uniref:hypothetical protein n=1 Tax=Sphingomonas sp. Leaf22 TaxID=1735687 RepID=UPI0006FD1A55|nr:hypothetical protein [Sphingomonas sp. Leaf22]KQM79334.1 hypothetical protein ASE70_05550 [Sphingomonas sp. Leaf22]
MPDGRAMTLLRTPDSSAAAVKKIGDYLGWRAAKVAAGARTVSAVRGWSDERTTSCPNWAQALGLDAAYLAAGGDHAPLLDAYAASLDFAIGEHNACRRALASKLAETAREYGDAIAATSMLTQPGHSDNDTLRALIEIDQAQGVLAALKRCVRSFRMPGAGPGHHGGGK